jgi:hypothetical protein
LYCWVEIFKVYQNLVITFFFLYFLLKGIFYHVKTCLWMIMMEFRIIMV